MDNIDQILPKLKIHKFSHILEIFIEFWQSHGPENQNEASPGLGVFLSNGQQLIGELLQVDFKLEMFSLRFGEEEENLHVSFIPFGEVKFYTLHHLEKCPRFVSLMTQN